MYKKPFLVSLPKFFAHSCISATIEDAAKQNIVLTFPSLKHFRRAVYGEFTVTGTAKTVDSITLGADNKTLTIHVSVAYAHNNTCTVVYNPTLKGVTSSKAVTNNIP